MAKLWQRILHAGVDDSVPARYVRYIELVNILAFATGTAQIVQSINLLSRWPMTAPAIYFSLLCAPGYYLVIVLNRIGFRHTARMFFNLYGLVQISGVGVVFGAAVGVHLLFLLVPITAFFTYPPDRRGSMYFVVALGAVWTVLGGELLNRSTGLLSPDPEFTAYLRLNGLISLTLFFLGFTYYIWRILGRAEARAEEERLRSENLLHSILPHSIAARLKQQPSVISDGFADASILFADVVGFTELAVRKSPAELVGILNDIFSRFDERLDQYRLEKIKTIGDAYMVAAGIPEPLQEHAEALCAFAVDIVGILQEYSRESSEELQIRIGIASGPVVAGVIGRKKFIYDLWGDSVNTAARMESHGVPGTIQVTERTYELARARFDFEARGEIDVKGKGRMRTFLLRP